MADDRWKRQGFRCGVALFVALNACSRTQSAIASDAAPPTIDAPIDVALDVTHDAPGYDATPVTLDDRCKRHDDCVAIGLYPEGELRCCLACIPQQAANKTSADAFIAMCAHERAMRECPVYDCAAPTLDPRCVGGRCMLAPRAK